MTLNQFRMAKEIDRNPAPWGTFHWVSHPSSTGAKQLTVLSATVTPGQGHGFHKHPKQEEVMYVVAGRVEQWLDREKRILETGDAIFIPAGVVHGTFNVSEDDARLMVVFSPCVGDGFESVELGDEPPWANLRNSQSGN